MTEFEVLTLQGQNAKQHIQELANLRIEVFKEYPYLYEGSLQEESKYLQSFLDNEQNILILATYSGRVIGASTAYPLSGADQNIQDALARFDDNSSKFFYFGESVLKKEYRGQGLGQKFFDEREKSAKQNHNVEYLAFCAVERSENDDRKPIDYHSPHSLWKRNGFQKHNEIYTNFIWPEVGQEKANSHKMTFWIKELK